MFATPVTRQTGSTTTNAGTHSITFSGTPVADELLLAFIAADGNPILDDSQGRWTKIAGQMRNGTIVTGCVLAKIAEGGGNDTLTVRTRLGDANQTQMVSWVTFRITNHGGLPVAIAANGSSTNSDPPAITPPWGNQDYLFIAARMGDGNVGATAAPANYGTLTGVTHTDATNGASVHTAERSINASTENPGTFTSATEQWAAFTVAVPPADMPHPKLWGKYEVTTTTSTTASIASPSFTPGDNELLVVKTGTADSTCVPSVPTSTGGVSFTSQVNAGNTTQFCNCRISTAEIGTSPGAITITQAFTGSGFVRGMVVERWKDAGLDATPNTAAATGSASASSTTLTTEAVNSVVSYINGDWQAVAPGAYAYRGTHTNETGIFDVTTTDVCIYWAYQHAPATGSQTLGLSSPAGQEWTIVGIEIQYKPAPGSAPTVRQVGQLNSSTLTSAVQSGTIVAATAGNILVVCAAGDKNTGTVAVTDNIGTNGGLNPWIEELELPGASVSAYLAWKVAVGGETTITVTTSAANTVGAISRVLELQQVGTDSWAVVAETSVPTYSDTAVSSRSTGTTSAAAAKGMGVGMVAIDSPSSYTGYSFSNNFSNIGDPAALSGAGGGNGQANVAVLPVASGATGETTMTITGGTDQMTGFMAVFGRQAAAAPSDTTKFFLSAAA